MLCEVACITSLLLVASILVRKPKHFGQETKTYNVPVRLGPREGFMVVSAMNQGSAEDWRK